MDEGSGGPTLTGVSMPSTDGGDGSLLEIGGGGKNGCTTSMMGGATSGDWGITPTE